MNTTTIVRAISKHEILIYNDFAEIYVPDGRSCYTPDEIDSIIEILQKSKKFYYENERLIKYHEENQKTIHQEKLISIENKLKRRKKEAMKQTYM